MKTSLFTASLLIALSFVATTSAKETTTTINGRPVIVRTETSGQAPAACVAALDQRVQRDGWNYQLFRTVGSDRAVVIFSQRNGDPCRPLEVKVTLWKAVPQGGKTVTEAWVYDLHATEVNAFLENELGAVVDRFGTAPGRTS